MLADATREAGHRRVTTRFPAGFDDEEFLEKIKTYLECRTRSVDPAAPLVEAWNCFYDFYAPWVRSFLRKRDLLEEERNDCFQDFWKEVVAHLGHFQYDSTRGRLWTWLAALARNTAADCIRERARHPTTSLRQHQAMALLDPGSDPAADYERRRAQNHVRRVLIQLSGQVSATSFQVLHLRWIEGRTVAEIADALELTPEQVRFRHHRVKRKLRDLLERAMDQDAFP
jgi:RNA polymerase sigma-70 factor (ECF subfamily)